MCIIFILIIVLLSILNFTSTLILRAVINPCMRILPFIVCLFLPEFSRVFFIAQGKAMEERYLIMPFGPKGQPGLGMGGVREKKKGGGVEFKWGLRSGGSGQSNGRPGADVEIVSIVTPPPPSSLVLPSSPSNLPSAHTKHVHGCLLRPPIFIPALVSVVNPFCFSICCSNEFEPSCSSCVVIRYTAAQPLMLPS